MDCGLTGLTFNDPSLCKPQFARECDLHYIIDSFMKTGRLPASCSVHSSSFQDAIDVPDNWQDLQDKIIPIKNEFENLPSDIRLNYCNDPLAWFIDTHNKPTVSEELQPAKAPDTKSDKIISSEPVKSSDPTVA